MAEIQPRRRQLRESLSWWLRYISLSSLSLHRHTYVCRNFYIKRKLLHQVLPTALFFSAVLFTYPSSVCAPCDTANVKKSNMLSSLVQSHGLSGPSLTDSPSGCSHIVHTFPFPTVGLLLLLPTSNPQPIVVYIIWLIWYDRNQEILNHLPVIWDITIAH